ncbi:MAG: type IV pilin protein [Salinisphaeraceae bacterium]
MPCPSSIPAVLRRYQRGMTLIELMIVVTVVGILAAVAYPSYVNVVVRNNRSVAHAALSDLVARQENFFTQRKRYAQTIRELGFPSSPTGVRNNGALDDLDKSPNPSDIVYHLQVSSAAPFSQDTNFRVEAVPTNMQTRDNDCGTLFITAAGTRGATGDKPDECW